MWLQVWLGRIPCCLGCWYPSSSHNDGLASTLSDLPSLTWFTFLKACRKLFSLQCLMLNCLCVLSQHIQLLPRWVYSFHCCIQLYNIVTMSVKVILYRCFSSLLMDISHVRFSSHYFPPVRHSCALWQMCCFRVALVTNALAIGHWCLSVPIYNFAHTLIFCNLRFWLLMA